MLTRSPGSSSRNRGISRSTPGASSDEPNNSIIGRRKAFSLSPQTFCSQAHRQVEDAALGRVHTAWEQVLVWLVERALYKRPQLLFLDEATSHLDVELEATVNAADCPSASDHCHGRARRSFGQVICGINQPFRFVSINIFLFPPKIECLQRHVCHLH